MLFEKMMVNYFSSQLQVRQDNLHGIFYFSPEDFPGLRAYEYAFPSSQGHTLRGFFYCYDNPIPGRVLVFDHGMGNGHRAYMREIECLAKAGYLVFSYDHTGCMASGGKHIGGFAQSLHDLDDCMKALKAEEALSGYTFSVVGHSWGGFSAMNIAALHSEITHVVAMSGFVSVEMILSQMFRGLMKGYVKPLLALEREQNPDYVDFSAVVSLQKTEAEVLLVYSADDRTVSKAVHYDALHAALSGRENIRFLLLNGKDHNPTYADDAVAYKNGFFADYQKAAKKKLLDTPEAQKAFMSRYDWLRMTEQDETVWQEIFKALV